MLNAGRSLDEGGLLHRPKENNSRDDCCGQNAPGNHLNKLIAGKVHSSRMDQQLRQSKYNID
jgi:hypothetical protein